MAEQVPKSPTWFYWSR